MLAKLRLRLTYANVMATVAVFIALGGTGYAAITLPKNSVRAKQIAPRAVQSSEAHNLTLRDFRRGVRARLKGEKGDTGPQGPQGIQGAQGVPGTARAYAIIDPSTCTTAAGPALSYERRTSRPPGDRQTTRWGSTVLPPDPGSIAAPTGSWPASCGM
jgi:hypothetical protein